MWPYQIILLVLAPVALLHSIWLAIRFREPVYLLQKFALDLPATAKDPVWIHAASVGEVNACQSLLQSYLQSNPSQRFLVSTNTLTGKKRLQQLFGSQVSHCYLPFDLLPCINHALRKLKPRCLLIVETEIWPNLFTRCHKNKIPLAIINGRISVKTLSANNCIKSAYKIALASVTKILTRSTTDSERFITLGANKNIVSKIGNLKYTIQSQHDTKPSTLQLPFILVVSSRDEEEELIVKAWQQAATPLMLAIAPRHPQRKAEILQALAQFNLTIAVRSQDAKVDTETDIYLIDTLGELNNFIAQCEFVIIGGSFVNKGGQNLIEAAHAGKAIIFGASMYNFSDEAEDFLQHQAAIKADNIDALTRTITDLSQNIANRNLIANNGKALVETYQHILVDYIDALEPIINAQDV